VGRRFHEPRHSAHAHGRAVAGWRVNVLRPAVHDAGALIAAERGTTPLPGEPTAPASPRAARPWHPHRSWHRPGGTAPARPSRPGSSTAERSPLLDHAVARRVGALLGQAVTPPLTGPHRGCVRSHTPWPR
jgi:hypothetical protein